MKIKIVVFFLILFMATTLFAGNINGPTVAISRGFCTGRDYIEMSEIEKRAYAMGAINGMLIAPLFNAPKKDMEWLESYTANMTDMQSAAILSKYLRDNPNRWHNQLNAIMYSAMKELYNKSR